MLVRITLDAEHRLVVPEAMRAQLKIGSGSTLLVEVQDGTLIVRPEPSDVVARLGALNREVWQDDDPAEFLRQEREAWGK